jgi:hypothetical protein
MKLVEEVKELLENEGHIYAVYHTLKNIKRGTPFQKAFHDAAMDQNYHGNREDIKRHREKIVYILKTQHGIDVNPHEDF